MGKQFLFTVALMIVVNGFWYCATQQQSIGETPAIVAPILACIVLCAFIARWVNDNWD